MRPLLIILDHCLVLELLGKMAVTMLAAILVVYTNEVLHNFLGIFRLIIRYKLFVHLN